MKTDLSRPISPERFVTILLGTPMEPILNFLKRTDRELSENEYFYPSLVSSFLVEAIWLSRCRDTSKVTKFQAHNLTTSKAISKKNLDGGGKPLPSHYMFKPGVLYSRNDCKLTVCEQVDKSVHVQ